MIPISDMAYNLLTPALRDRFLDAARRAAVDARAHGLEVEKEALGILRERGVTVVECDREAFRKRVEPQMQAFMRNRPESKPVIEQIQAITA